MFDIKKNLFNIAKRAAYIIKAPYHWLNWTEPKNNTSNFKTSPEDFPNIGKPLNSTNLKSAQKKGR
jgi:hypothetical protein